LPEDIAKERAADEGGQYTNGDLYRQNGIPTSQGLEALPRRTSISQKRLLKRPDSASLKTSI